MNVNLSDSENKSAVLLVDDDRLVLASLAQGLTVAGYQVDRAETVDEAEAFLDEVGERPDLIVLDVHMPGRNGLELAERLTSRDHIPFILLTAYNDESIVKQAADTGALSYLVKPIDSPQLISCIETVLARAKDFKNLRETKNQLTDALTAERDISIAIGITMVQYRLDRRSAFELLRKSARGQRRKLADLALDIIKGSEMLNLGN